MAPTLEEHPHCSGPWNRPERYERECFWYREPIIDPHVILRPSQVIVGWVNPLLAILVVMLVGVTGFFFASLSAADAKRAQEILRRLPLQAVLTLALLWLVRVFIPEAQAQGIQASGTSLSLLYLYVGVFFVVVNLSNFLFNNIVTSKGDRIHESIVSHPIIDRFVTQGKRLSHETWLIVLLFIAYGVIGAHINPHFSLFPQEHIGIVFVTTTAIILSAYSKDFVRFLLAKTWKFPAWFKANVPGLFVAVVSVALTRSLGLSPGYIYGVPVGLFIVSHLYPQREGLFECLGLLWLMFLALVLWFCAPLLTPYPVLSDAINLFFVIAIEHAFIETFPLPYLAGGSIFRWSKIVWAMQFAVATFLLFRTLFNPKGTLVGLSQSPPALATMFLLGCYVAGVLLLWGYIVLKSSKRH